MNVQQLKEEKTLLIAEFVSTKNCRSLSEPKWLGMTPPMAWLAMVAMFPRLLKAVSWLSCAYSGGRLPVISGFIKSSEVRLRSWLIWEGSVPKLGLIKLTVVRVVTCNTIFRSHLNWFMREAFLRCNEILRVYLTLWSKRMCINSGKS